MSKFLLATAAAAAISSLAGVDAVAQSAPVVQGPESVSDWYKAGDKFVRDSERVEENRGYHFISDRARKATAKWGVASVSILARKRG